MSIWTSVCEWFEPLGAMLWLNALVIVPLTMLAAIISSIPRLRPVTRHGAWLVALIWCLLPPVLPAFRVQIDDHTTHTPLSVPHSADAGRVASPPLSAGSPIRFNASRSGEFSESGLTDTDRMIGSGALNRTRAPRVFADAKPLNRQQNINIDRSVAPGKYPVTSPAVLRSTGRGAIDPLDGSDPSRPVELSQLDRSRRPRVFIFAPYWSSLDLLDADSFQMARERDVECVSNPPCESPLPWEPDGDLAFYPPAASPRINGEKGVGPDAHSDANASIVISAPGASDSQDVANAILRLSAQAGKANEPTVPHVPNETTAQGSVARDTSHDDTWQNHLYVQPVGDWVGGLMEIRDAIGRLPVMPSQVWIGGMLLTALVFGAFMADGRRRLRGAYPAPPEVCDLVRFASERMGLSRSPRVMLVDRRMSPMIWCGRRSTLVLPADLWDELDDAGRHAVIFHELAHLLRRDHWVCRLSIAATCLYWWHPLVWWVRKRVHEEAEMCCDAWVVWHLPSSRRAYADTLLRARQYLSCPSTLSPALSMSAASNEKQKFARRLTMVMTQRSKPHRGSASIVLLAALCLAGWAATPAVSSPPTAAPPDESTPAEPNDVVLAPIAPTDPTVLAAGPTPHMASTAPLALAPANADDGEETAKSNRELRQQMAELQRHVEELSRKVENLTELAERNAQRAAERVQRPARPAPPRVEGAGDAQFAPLGVATRASGKVFSRKYSMPEGKLEAFTQLMARDDVPVLISPGDDSITVQGTTEQHAIVEGFINIINRERKDETQAYELSEGKLKDLTKLMIRNDVPIRVRPGDDKIQVIGTPAEQAVFKAFIELIRPDNVDMHNLGAVRDVQRPLGFAGIQADEADAADRLKFEEAIAQLNWRQDQVREQVDQSHMHRDKLLLNQDQRAKKAERAHIESLMEMKEKRQERIEESKRAYREAMKRLELDLARQKQRQDQ